MVLQTVHGFKLSSDRVRYRIAGKLTPVWPGVTWQSDTPDEIRRHTAHIRPLVEELDQALRDASNVINLLMERPAEPNPGPSSDGDFRPVNNSYAI